LAGRDSRPLRPAVPGGGLSWPPMTSTMVRAVSAGYP